MSLACYFMIESRKYISPIDKRLYTIVDEHFLLLSISGRVYRRLPSIWRETFFGGNSTNDICSTLVDTFDKCYFMLKTYFLTFLLFLIFRPVRARY